MNFVAIIEDAIYPDAPKHVAKCQSCQWRDQARNRQIALRSGAAHVEETRHTVCVEAVDIDWLVAVPDLPKYRERRVPGAVAPSTATHGKENSQ